MQIVSASRRTDIPAFYTPWFVNRLRAGFVRVPNPFNPRQIATVDLRPEQVACLVFWTKDPRPLLAHLPELEARQYRSIFHVTLTGLPTFFEPRVPAAADIIGAIAELSRVVGPQRVIWRFDPIVVSSLTPESLILSNFTALSEALQGKVRRCVLSYARFYRQVHSRMKRSSDTPTDVLDLSRLSPGEALERIAPLTASLVGTASRRGMEIVSCAEPLDLPSLGVLPGRCIDAQLLHSTFGLALPTRKDVGQRPECGCARSIDIGIYGTCGHRCLYCYARADSALERGCTHDPGGEMLLRG